MDDNKNKTDDFFSLLEKDQKIENPFTTDEILFRDEGGNLKVLKGGEVLDFDQKASGHNTGFKKGNSQQPVLDKPAVAKAPVVTVKEEAKEKVTLPSGKRLNVDQEVEDIISKSGVNLTDEELKRRFKNTITLRLREVRDQIQTREMLLSSPLIGGMGFDSQTADRILAIINKEFERLDGRLREEVSSEPFSDLRAEAKKLLEQPLTEAKAVRFESRQAPVENISEIKIESAKPRIAPKPQAVSPVQSVSFNRPVVSPPSAKPKIEDVKFRPRLTGPIEEIRSMTLVDFRRLAQTPEKIIEKILEKIELLEEESFTKKTEAIKAWKESEVYRLYLELGDQSMAERKPISEIIAQRQRLNQPTLTEEELEAIFELNQRLRY